jgi:predicted aminopeptidase
LLFPFVPGVGCLLLPIFLAGCSPAYVLRAGYEEARILWYRQPIEEILQRPSLEVTTRDKLRLVLRVRQFAEQELGLRVGGSYTSLSEVKTPLVYVITAAPKTRLEPYTWWFPIVGRVAYKGFFNESAAKHAVQSLETKGYDTVISRAIAFSTLGWFADPLLPHLLMYNDEILVNTIIHELFHSTFYLPGQTAFNESLANFAGHRGAIAFFVRENGSEAEAVRQATTSWESELALSGFFAESAEKLTALYDSPLAEEEKLHRREELFVRLQEEFRQLPRPVRRNVNFATIKLNNAVFLQQFAYIKELALFEQIYQQQEQDLRAALSRIMAVAKGEDDPYAALRPLINGLQPQTVTWQGEHQDAGPSLYCCKNFTAALAISPSWPQKK